MAVIKLWILYTKFQLLKLDNEIHIHLSSEHCSYATKMKGKTNSIVRL